MEFTLLITLIIASLNLVKYLIEFQLMKVAIIQREFT